MIVALFALGCGTSPIDAVVSDDVMAQAGAAASSPDEGDCREPASGRFVLRAERGCLSRGSSTSVFGTPAFSVELSADCSSSEAQWDLTPSVAGTFTLRHVESNLLLDVRAGADLPGTAVILYDANMLDNQRFWLRPRAADAYELSPRHAPSLCAEARSTGVELWECDESSSSQDFALFRDECE